MAPRSARFRGALHRNAPAARGLAALLTLGTGLACGRSDRPALLSDLTLDGARRFVGGRFGAAAPDAGAANVSADGGLAGADASAGHPIGSSGSAGSPAPTSATAITQSQIYEAKCGAASMVQWGFVTYAASTPGDSFIEFRLRAAAGEAELEAARFVELIRASTALGTSRCALTGPAPDCPVDLFVRLGGAPLAHLPLLQVEAVLHPATADQRLPGVAEWRMDYSCTDAR